MLTSALAALLVAIGSSAAEGETLYHFVDEYGVPHFSNQPLDPRYRPIQLHSPSRLNSLGGRSVLQQAQALEVYLLAPTQAGLGEAFDVTISIPSSKVVRGWVEVSFDPDALELDTISEDDDSPEPGKVRLDVDSEVNASFAAAAVTFYVVAQRPTDVSVELTRLDLRGETNEPLNLRAGAPATIRLVN